MSRNSDNGHPQRRYIVRGRVQRVGFRYATCRQANALGLAGYVRNLTDGRVEIFAQGPGRELEKLRQWLHKGPIQSRVEEVSELFCSENLGPGFGIQ